jgi:putative addiction module component (TIGR02574 family)
MDREFNELREEVLSLDRESQIRIAEEILTNVARTPELEEAWREEVRRRVEAYRAGDIKTVSSEDVIARARQKIESATKRQ